MALINTSLPNLIQGVSQQPDALRYDGQCEEQENALSSVVDGLTKRPNTRHVARLLLEAISSDSYVHFINRDANERYVAIYTNKALRIFNLEDGTEATIVDTTVSGVGIPTVLGLSRTPVNGLATVDSDGNSFNELSSLTANTAGNQYTASGIRFPSDPDWNGKVGFMVNNETDTGDITVGQEYHVRLRVSAMSAHNWTMYLYSGKQAAEDGVVYSNKAALSVTGSEQVITLTISQEGPYGAFLAFEADDVLSGDTPSITIESADFIQYTPAQGEAPTSGLGVNVPYLTTSNPRESLEFLTVADFTFLLNKNKIVQADTATTEELEKSPFVYVAQGDYKKEYTINGTFSSDTTADTAYVGIGGTFTSGVSSDAANASTKIIRNGLKTATEDPIAGGIWESVGSSGMWASYNVEDAITSDGLADTGLQLVYKSVDSSSALPAFCVNDHKVKVSGDPELSQDDYYVKFVVDNDSGNDVYQNDTSNAYTTGEGHWEETQGFGISQGLDASTMPLSLVNVAPNVFEVRLGSYSPRAAGDDETNPHPSFVGKTINSQFFFKNRLGFLTGESVVISEAGQFFNFYRNTVTTLLDSAPIDVSASTTKVTTLRHATGFQENLMIFGDGQQFVLKGGDLLTPKTVSITPVTNFDIDTKTQPQPLGSYIYFPFTRGNHSGVREFNVNPSTETYDAAEITSHTPRYVPKDIISMSGSSAEDLLVLLSADEPNALYVYKYFWNANQKVLSSWSKFTMACDIRGTHFIDSTLYIVAVHNNETHIVELPLEAGLTDDAGYTTYLDQRVSAAVLSGADTITLPYTPDASDDIEVYTQDGLKLQSSFSGSTVTLNSPVTEDTDVWVGYPYTMKYKFSEQLFKDSAGGSKSPSAASKLMVRNGALFFDNTAYFQVKVTPKARQTYVNTFTPDVVGSTTLGQLNLDSGFFRFPVFTKATDTTITIENDSALPSNFQSAEFESFVHSRSNRYG